MNTTTLEERHILTVDRTKPFDPSGYAGTSWSGSKTVDKRSLSITQIDLLHDVTFQQVVEPNEESITGHMRLKRLRSMELVLLDTVIFFAIWEKRNEQLLLQPHGRSSSRVSLDGTVFTSNDGTLATPFFYWDGKELKWSMRSLDQEWPADYLSLVYKPRIVITIR